jgi:hypothetical protein
MYAEHPTKVVFKKQEVKRGGWWIKKLKMYLENQ